MASFADILKADADNVRDDFAGTFRQTLEIGTDTVTVAVSVVDSGDSFGDELAGIDVDRRVRVTAAVADFDNVPVEKDEGTLDGEYVIVASRPNVDISVVEMELKYQ